MTGSHSLQDLIIEKAGQLFREQGYAATTIKQIAKAAGCTTAALYYYFEDGKQHILREVIRTSARDAEASMHFPQAESLDEFLIELSAILAQRFPQVADRFNWLILQFAALPDQEKRILQDQVLGIQRQLRQQISQYVADQGMAERLAWLLPLFQRLLWLFGVHRRLPLQPPALWEAQGCHGQDTDHLSLRAAGACRGALTGG